MNVAIIKPDHIGDLVLSSAAIRAIMRRHPNATLFIAGKNRSLARHLFGDVAIETIDFPHLTKADASQGGYPDLRGFDMVAFLRSDGILNTQWASLRCRRFVLPVDTHGDHQSVIDFGVASALVGHYDIEEAFYTDRLERVRAKASRFPGKVGFSIGSGFHANSWPPGHWIALGRKLRDAGIGVSVISGPAEAGLARFLLRQIGLDPVRDLILGGKDFAGFLGQVDELDWVVASDGGTGHLCSLVCPTLSVFGPSPFRRYAPFGTWARLLTMNLDCSPCCQYSARLVNGCLTTECVTGINAQVVMDALRFPHSTGMVGSSLEIAPGCQLYLGVSHLDHRSKIESRLLENGVHHAA